MASTRKFWNCHDSALLALLLASKALIEGGILYTRLETKSSAKEKLHSHSQDSHSDILAVYTVGTCFVTCIKLRAIRMKVCMSHPPPVSLHLSALKSRISSTHFPLCCSRGLWCARTGWELRRSSETDNSYRYFNRVKLHHPVRRSWFATDWQECLAQLHQSPQRRLKTERMRMVTVGSADCNPVKTESLIFVFRSTPSLAKK